MWIFGGDSKIFGEERKDRYRKKWDDNEGFNIFGSRRINTLRHISEKWHDINEKLIIWVTTGMIDWGIIMRPISSEPTALNDIARRAFLVSASLIEETEKLGKWGFGKLWISESVLYCTTTVVLICKSSKEDEKKCWFGLFISILESIEEAECLLMPWEREESRT